MESTKNILWRKIALAAAVISGILLTAWLGLEIAYAADFDSTRRAAYLHIAGLIKGFALGVFDFAKPFVQVAFALFILHWLAKRFAPSFDLSKYNWQELSMEKMLIGMVTIGFVIVSVRVGLDSLPHVKDVMLVVIGLYFGIVRKP